MTDVPGTQWPAFDIERTAIRVLVQDADERVLLLQVRDTHRDDQLIWWELPGGGIEDGETPADAAARELVEETGIVISPKDIPEARWHRDCTYRYRGLRILQHERIVSLRIKARAPVPTAHRRTTTELEDVIGHRWWTVAEIQASDERFFPGRLPEFVQGAIAGSTILEPFDHWD